MNNWLERVDVKDLFGRHKSVRIIMAYAVMCGIDCVHIYVASSGDEIYIFRGISSKKWIANVRRGDGGYDRIDRLIYSHFINGNFKIVENNSGWYGRTIEMVIRE